MPKTTSKPKKEEHVLHFFKYLQKKNFNQMQIAAVEATIKSKKEKKTEAEWNEIFNKIINKRLR